VATAASSAKSRSAKSRIVGMAQVVISLDAKEDALFASGMPSCQDQLPHSAQRHLAARHLLPVADAQGVPVFTSAPLHRTLCKTIPEASCRA